VCRQVHKAMCWVKKQDLNLLPSAFKADALPSELFSYVRLVCGAAGGVMGSRTPVFCVRSRCFPS
jgi:hypothetical protein